MQELAAREAEGLRRLAAAARPAEKPDLAFNDGYEPGSTALYVQSAEGPWIKDRCGVRYVDLGLGAGSAVLGHAPPPVVEAVREQAGRGSLFIAPHAALLDFTETLGDILPAFGGFAFCNSGAEATMRAMRIARAVTGKRKIAVFSGGWHGGHDLALVEEAANSPRSRPIPTHRTAGTPTELLDLLLFLPYNDPAALDLIRAHADEIAMVLVEPAQGSNPRDDVGPFLADLRRVTSECGVLLGFDEIITGFRLGLQGGQGYFDVTPDIATYGKIVGGGLPVGMVAGRREVMERIRGGGGAAPVFLGGTFSGNPLVVAAGHAAVKTLRDGADTLYPALATRFNRLRDAINTTAATRGWPVRVINAAAFGRLLFTDRFVASRHDRDRFEAPYALQNRFYRCLPASGVHVGGNRILFLSGAHGDAEVDLVRDAFLDTLDLFDRAGAFSS